MIRLMHKYRYILIILLLCLFVNSGCQSASEKVSSYSYGNMQKNVPPGNFIDDGSSILFFDPSGANQSLLKMDKESFEVNLFCSDPTCLHNDEKCMAGGASFGLENYLGEIYASNDDNQLLVLKKDHFVPVANGDMLGGSVHGNHHMYLSTKDNALMEYDLKGKSSRTIIEEFDGIWPVISDSYLVYNTLFEVCTIDLNQPENGVAVAAEGIGVTDGKQIFYMDNKNQYLHACDLTGNNDRVLIEKPVLPASINFDEEYLYFRYYYNNDLACEESNIVYRLKKEGDTPPEVLSEMTDHAYTIYTIPDYDYIFVVTKNNFMGSESSLYAVRKDGQDRQLINLP